MYLKTEYQLLPLATRMLTIVSSVDGILQKL